MLKYDKVQMLLYLVDNIYKQKQKRNKASRKGNIWSTDPAGLQGLRQPYICSHQVSLV